MRAPAAKADKNAKSGINIFFLVELAIKMRTPIMSISDKPQTLLLNLLHLNFEYFLIDIQGVHKDLEPLVCIIS
jgi:hypothetical protein